ncbi:MAG TPA: glycosyl hydrolase family 18 protein [Candidatus Paceibacterota bacterium]|nr:glycosyl hydrolase family 18 protein [Candidatus Paceibacterota bacterium]
MPNISQARDLEFSVWVPYWKKTMATAETLAHLDQLTSILPFSYEVKADGTIWDPMRISQDPWPKLLTEARAKKIKIIPSILWSDGVAIRKIMSTKKSRDTHIKQIIALVNEGKLDGIDIDYENKPAEVYYTFGAFIRDLSTELHKNKKILSCTVEPRLPPSSRFLVIPEKIYYANNYEMLNRYCDEVRIMAYDQMTADILLNRRKKSLGLYTPIADLDFVKKVLAYTSHEIAPSKTILGVVNYGYAYQVIDKGTFYDYKKLSALSYKTFWDLAKSTGSTPMRNTAGELSFAYYKDGQNRYAVLSDSVAIATKITLAKNLGLRGVSLFKVDGESDPKLWEVLK